MDLRGRGIPQARLQSGSKETLSGEDGSFTLPVDLPGPVLVRVEAKGFEPREATWNPKDGPLNFILHAQAFAVVEVQAGTEHSSEGPTATLGRMEVLRIPGAGGDAFQAAKDLPGVAQTSDSPRLLVRGGRAPEAGIYLNDGRLFHPYHFPGTQNSIHSAVGSGIAHRVNFSPGGFSARYGDALSAILDMDVDDPEMHASGTLAVNLAGMGLSFDRPMGSLGLRLASRLGSPALLNRIYGLGQTYEGTPTALDLNVNLQGRLAEGSPWSATVIGIRDRMTLQFSQDNASGRMEFGNTMRFVNARVHKALGAVAMLKFTATHTGFNQDWTFDRIHLDTTESAMAGRTEFMVQLPGDGAIEAGAEGERISQTFAGSVPSSTPSGFQPIGTRAIQSRWASYASWRMRLGDDLGLSLGGRRDFYTSLNQATSDARATLSYLLAPGHTFRLSYGTFHQAPSQDYLNATASQAFAPAPPSPGLPVMGATHALASLESLWGSGLQWQFRLEAYRKRYRDLPLLLPDRSAYTGGGHGVASGVDVYLRCRAEAWKVWMSYGYLDARRKEADQPNLGPISLSVPHSITLGSTWTFSNGVDLGLIWRQASGVPFTPVVGGTPRPDGTYAPVYGAPYSERLPGYRRLDARVSRYFSPSLIAFLEVNNLASHANVANVAYTADYSARKPASTYYARRVVVAGFIFRW